MQNQITLELLHWSLQALAQPGEIQIGLFPDFVCKADELALDYDHWWTYTSSHHAEEFTVTQAELLDKLDTSLSEISGENHAALWTDEALRCHPKWAEVREMAKQALDALGWSSEPPLPNPNTLYFQATE